MRSIRKEIIKLCEYRMRSDDNGNVDAFILLLNRLKYANSVGKLAKHKRSHARFLNDCLDAIVQKVELLKGRKGAARIIYGQFSGRSASILHRRLNKAFEDLFNSSAGQPSSAQPRQPAAASSRDTSVNMRQSSSSSSGGGAWRRKVFNPSMDTCFRCGKVGHMSRDCVVKVERI